MGRVTKGASVSEVYIARGWPLTLLTLAPFVSYSELSDRFQECGTPWAAAVAPPNGCGGGGVLAASGREFKRSCHSVRGEESVYDKTPVVEEGRCVGCSGGESYG